jgi:hypothetical protein
VNSGRKRAAELFDPGGDGAAVRVVEGAGYTGSYSALAQLGMGHVHLTLQDIELGGEIELGEME